MHHEDYVHLFFYVGFDGLLDSIDVVGDIFVRFFGASGRDVASRHFVVGLFEGVVREGTVRRFVPSSMDYHDGWFVRAHGESCWGLKRGDSPCPD